MEALIYVESIVCRCAQGFWGIVIIEYGGGLGGIKMPKPSKNNAFRAATEQINAVPEGSKMPPNESENSSQADLRVEYRPIEALIPFARNPRTHSDNQVAQITASIREFGFTNPILLDGENGIIAGHRRMLAAKELGLEKAGQDDPANLPLGSCGSRVKFSGCRQYIKDTKLQPMDND